MKKIIFLTLFISFISNAVPLAGDYFINQNGSEDYSSITAAVADLNSEGISAPVTFKIRSGTYDEQVTITEINRFGIDNDLVIFKRATFTDTVVWKYSSQNSANNWILATEDTKFLRIANINFVAVNSDAQTMLYLDGETDSITVTKCQFQGLIPASINNFRSELVLTSFSNYIADANSTGMLFENNSFINGFKGIWSNYISSPMKIINNEFTGQANTGIDLVSDELGSLIESNEFSDAIWTFTSLPYQAINVNGRVTIKNNKINIAQKGVFGINAINNYAGNDLHIYNNFISITNPNGHVIAASLGNRVKFLHNTIRTEQATDIAIQLNASVTNTVTINNNIVINTGGGIALDLPLDDSISAIDELSDNNLFTSSGTLVSWGEVSPGVSRTFNTINGFQTHVQSFLPNVGLSNFIIFAGTTNGDVNDLHLPLLLVPNADLVAHPQAEVIDDIDGDSRTSINVYIGADQSALIVEPMDNADAINGSFYTVGGNSPDFLTPQEALDNLHHRGTKAEVKFKIRAGTYATKAYISNLVRLDDSDLVTIVASNPNNHPLLTSMGPASQNSVIKLVNSDEFIIKNIDFEMLGTGNVGITVEESKANTIEGCHFAGGKSGIRVESFGYAFYKNTLMNNNFINQNTSAITIDNMNGQTISGNTINANNFDYKGIEILNVSSTQFYPTVIESNKIFTCTTSVDCFGLFIDNSSGIENYRALIKNNFIHSSTDIHLENSSSYWNIYHNTLVAHLFGIKTLASTGNDTTNLDIINNIIDTFSDAVLSINSGSQQLSNNINVDYNLYSSGISTTLIQWFSQDFTALQTYQGTTGGDYNSLVKHAHFVDQVNEDYHLSSSSIGDNDLAGLYMHINSDIDGDSRSTSFPYIGADEASTPLSVARVQVDNSWLTPDNITGEESTQVNLVIRLMAQPTDDVTIAFATDNINEGNILAPAQLIFTSINWSQSQTITIQGVDDFISDGNIDYSVLYSVLSDDAEYDAIPIQVLNFINTDNDLNSKIALELVNHASEPSTSATVKFKLLKDATAPNDTPLIDMQDITIDYTYNGNTATLNSDYSPLSGSVVLPALNEFVEININPIDDNLIEQTEDLAITITSITGGLAFVSVDNITNGLVVNINDNDTGLITVSNSLNLSEPATNGGFELALTGGVSETDTEISYSFAGTANHTSDYAPVSGIATIPAMSSSVIIPINVVDDIDSENQENITINLDTSDNSLISVSPGTPPFVSIIDNDTNADIGVMISTINPTAAIGDVIDFTITVDNASPINIHQAVLQVLEPLGLSFYDWQCYGGASLCTQGIQNGDINDVISINANSSFEYQVFALVTGQMEDSLLIEAILNPAPFLNDTDTSNNTAYSSSLIDVFFQNGFEEILNKQLFEKVSGFTKTTDNLYYFIKENSGVYTFIEVNKNLPLLRYRYIEVNINSSSIISGEWLNGRN